MTRDALRTKMTVLLLLLILVGITAGVALLGNPLTLQNRAAEPNKCEEAIVTCSIADGTYDKYIIQIINQEDGTLIKAGGIGDPLVTALKTAGKVYTCHVIGVTGGGAQRSDCTPQDATGTAPFCQGPTVTPSLPSVTPVVPTTTPTPYIVTPIPTGPLYEGCPIDVKGIDPTMCVTDGSGNCITKDSVPTSCVRTQEWKCGLSTADSSTINKYRLRYRLAVYDDAGLKAKTPINDTRDELSDQTEVGFMGTTEIIYTCRLEVFDEPGLSPRECSHMSGRMRCIGVTPPPSGITPSVRIPTSVTPTASLTTCSLSSGDLNLDGNVDNRDVNLFVRSQFSSDNIAKTDVNCDGKVDTSDWSLLFSRVFGS